MCELILRTFTKTVKDIFIVLFILIFITGPAPVSLADIMESGFYEEANPIISMDYKNADISDVLDAVSKAYSLNIVAGKDIRGKITVSLRDVKLDEALYAILDVNGYHYVRRGNIIVIKPLEEGLDSDLIKINYTAAGSIKDMVSSVLSAKGSMQIDEISNAVIVTDSAANLEKIRDLVARIDTPPLQVNIEAKLVDIQTTDLENLGVTWSGTYTISGLLSSFSTTSDETVGGSLNLAGPSSDLSGGEMTFSLGTEHTTISTTVDALIQDQKANLLANPSITTLNNKEAKIVIGEKVPYREETTTTTGTTQTTVYVDVGITLKVTPQVNSDGYITMKIHPEVSSVSSLLDAGPRITTREADTTVMIKDGETLVIAGLLKTDESTTRSRMPILGYIPVVGLLFGNKSVNNVQKELAIFITPHIIRADNTVKSAPEGSSAASLHAEDVFVRKMFESAEKLEKNAGVESTRKPEKIRFKEALETYGRIVTLYPESPLTPDAQYRIARIYRTRLDDEVKAEEAYAKLVSDYPDFGKIDEAKKYIEEKESLRAVERAREEEARKKEEGRVKIEGDKLRREAEAARNKAQRESDRQRRLEQKERDGKRRREDRDRRRREKEELNIKRNEEKCLEKLREAEASRIRRQAAEELRAREDESARLRKIEAEKIKVREQARLDAARSADMAAVENRKAQRAADAARDKTEKERQKQLREAESAKAKATKEADVLKKKADKERESKLAEDKRIKDNAQREADAARDKAAKERRKELREAESAKAKALKDAEIAKKKADKERESKLAEDKRIKDRAQREIDAAQKKADKERRKKLREAESAKAKATKEAEAAQEKADRARQAELRKAEREREKELAAQRRAEEKTDRARQRELREAERAKAKATKEAEAAQKKAEREQAKMTNDKTKAGRKAEDAKKKTDIEKKKTDSASKKEAEEAARKKELMKKEAEKEMKRAEQERVKALKKATAEAKKAKKEAVREYLIRGKALFKEGDYAGSIKVFQRALELDPSGSAARNYINKARKKLE